MTIVYNSNNVITAPTDFSLWTTSGTTATLATGVTNPAGTQDDVYEFRATVTSGTHTLTRTFTAGQKWLSVYIKVVPTNPADSVGIGRGTVSANRVFYDLIPIDGGALSGAGSDIVSHSFNSVGGGWYLLKINTETVTADRIVLFVGTITGTASFLPSATLGMYVWGAFAYTSDESYFTITSPPVIGASKTNWGMRRFTRKNTIFLPS